MADFPTIEGGPSETVNVNTANSVDTSQGASGTSNTLSAWASMTASTNEDGAWLMVECRCQNAGSQLCDIGIGAAGSEQALIQQLLFESASNNGDPGGNWLFPIGVPLGSRLAQRNQMTVASGSAFQQVSILADGLLAPDTLQRCATYGAVSSSASRGTQVDPGGVLANTKGAWTQIAASTTFDIKWLVLSLGCNNATNLTSSVGWLIDIGVGGAGSEQVIMPDLFSYASLNGDVPRPQTWAFPTSIPSGSRLAVRAQSDSTSATFRILDVVLYGAG